MQSFVLLSAAVALTFPLVAQAQYQGGYGNYPGDRNEGAMQACREAVRQQAYNQFGSRVADFRDMRVDQDTGVVAGRIDVPGANNPDRYEFRCSMDLQDNNVRSVQIYPMTEGPNEGYRERSAGAFDRARENCRSAVAGRLADQGFGRVRFDSMQPDREGDRLFGAARAIRGDRSESFRFNCSVDPDDGDLRSVQVTPQ